MIMRKKNLAILFLTVAMLCLTVLPFGLNAPRLARASRSNQGTLTDGEWSGSQTTGNLITIGSGSLTEQGWNNIHDQINSVGRWYAEDGVKLDTPEYGWGIQAKNSSDDIGDKKYENGVWYRITLSKADKVKADKGDLTISASALYYRQNIAGCVHYVSLKLFFDDASGTQIGDPAERKETIKSSAYPLSITDYSVPKRTASIRYYVSNWGSHTARPFIGGLTCTLSDKTAPAAEKTSSDKSGIFDAANNIAIEGDTLKYFVEFDEKVSVTSFGEALLGLNGNETGILGNSSVLTENGKSKVCYSFHLPAITKNGKLTLYSVKGLSVKDEAGNQSTYDKSAIASDAVQFYKEMTVSPQLTNLTLSGKTKASYGTDYTATLKADAGYDLPQSISVRIDGGPASASAYTYNSSTGKITIKGTYIKGDVKIIASGVAKTSTVTLDMQKGSGGTLSVTATYNETLPQITAPKLTGYTFQGYYAQPEGQGEKYYDSAGASAKNCDFYTATTLYAYWTANAYTVKYEKNKPVAASGTVTGSTADSTHVYDEEKQLTGNGFSLTGWTLQGWATTANGAVVYEDGQKVKNLSAVAGSAVTLYAVWKANTYYVEYDPNKPAETDGTVTGTTSRSTHVYDTPGALAESGFSLTGWTFQGWAKTPGATNAEYRAGEKVTNFTSEAGGSFRLYAVWKANTYKIAYAPNQPVGASGAVGGSIAETTHIYDQTKALANNAFALTGWTFQGWAKDPGAATAEFTDGAEALNLAYAEGAIVTLYAVWKANEYAVTYAPNAPAAASGTVAGSTLDSAHVYDEEKPLTENGYTLTGWTFQGWAKTANGAVVYEDEQSVKNLSAAAGSAVTLYAVWKANTYTITFDAAGGSVTEAISATFDGALSPLSAPTRKGYNFNGYFSGQNGSGTQYFDADGNAATLYTVAGDVRLYAYWTPISYNIQLYSQGKYAETLRNVVFGTMRLPSAETLHLTRANYNFVGWNLYDDQNWAMYVADTDYATGIAGTEGETVTLYAAWAEKPVFTVGFDANGGLGAPAMAQAHQDETVTLSDLIPTRKDYTFLGWATEAGAKSAQYLPGDAFTMGNAVVTFYAVWKHNPALGYDANGGAFSVPAERTCPAAGTMTTLTDLVPARTGYAFLGWSRDKDGTAAEFVSGQEIEMPDEDTVLYAIWEKAQYRVTLSVNAGYTVAGLNESYYFDQTATFTVTGDRPKVYVNGQRLTAAENGEYSFTVQGESRVLVADGSKLSLVYSANGGTNAPTDDTSYSANNTTTVSSAFPERTGYTFLGWAKDPGADTAEYTADQPLTFASEDVVLYAVWQANSYTVGYRSGGGEGSMPQDTFRFGTKGTLSFNAFRKVGHTFVGWALSENGEAVYGDGAEILDLCATNGGNVTLYAVWQSTVTVITFLTENGTEYNSPISVAYGERLSSDGMIAPVRTGYLFAGYRTERNGSGELIFDAALNVAYTGIWDKNVNKLTLYSCWIPVSYTVVYVNGQTEAGRQSAVYGQAFDLLSARSLGVTAPKGYHFAGWSALPSGQSAAYADEQTIAEALTKINDDKVYLYAVFAADRKFSVIYSANGGSNAPVDDAKYFAGESVPLPATVPVREGYLFAGWSYGTGGTADFPYAQDVGFAEDSVTMADGGLTLYAVWTLNGKTLQEQIDEVSSVNASLASAIADLKTADTGFASQLETLGNKMQAAQDLLSSLDGTYATKQELADKVAELKNLLSQAKTDLTAKIDQVQTNLEAAVDTLNDTIAGNQQGVETRLAAVEQSYADMNTLLNSRLTELQNKDTALSNSIADLEKVRKETDDKLLEMINGVKADLTNAVSALNETISTNQQGIEERLAALEQNYQTLNAFVNSELAKLQDKDAELSTKLAELERVRKETDDTLLEMINGVKADLLAAVDTLNETISTNQQGVEERLSALEQKYTTLNAFVNSELKKLQDKDAELSTKLADLEQTRKETDDKLLEMINGVKADLTNAVSALNETISTNQQGVEERLAALEQKYTTLNAFVNSELTKLQDKDTALSNSIADLERVRKETDDKLLEMINGVKADLLAAVDTLNETISTNQQDVEESLSALEQKYTTLNAFVNSELVKLQDKDAELSTKLAELERVRKETDDKLLEMINGVKADLETAVSSLNETIASNKGDVESKLAEVKQASDTANAIIRSDLAALTNADADLTERIDALENTSTAAHDAIWEGIHLVQKNLDGAKSQFEAKNRNLETQLSSLQALSIRIAIVCIAGFVIGAIALTLIIWNSRRQGGKPKKRK